MAACAIFAALQALILPRHNLMPGPAHLLCGGSTVTPIDLNTNRAEKPIKIGSGWDSGFEAIVTVP